jgi:MFS family permease
VSFGPCRPAASRSIRERLEPGANEGDDRVDRRRDLLGRRRLRQATILPLEHLEGSGRDAAATCGRRSSGPTSRSSAIAAASTSCSSAIRARLLRTTATNPWIVLVLICLAHFMVVLDATIVNVALPSIQNDLHLSDGGLQWIVNAYTLVFGGFLLLGGRLGDLLGLKRLFLIGLAVFTGAPLLDGLAGSESMLVGARALPGARRSVDLAGRAVDHLDDVRGGRGAGPRARRVDRDRDRRLRRRLDPRWRADAVLLVAVDLLRQRAGRDRGFRALAPLRAGVAGRARAPQLRPRRRRHGHGRADGARQGPLEAGLAFLPFTVGIMISASLASQFAPRIGVRPVAAVGFLLAAAGLVLLTQLPVDGSYAVNVLPAILLSALGMRAVFMPLTLIATTGLADEGQELASGLFNTSQQIGGALGLAVLSTLATSKTHAAGGRPPCTRSWPFSIAHSASAPSAPSRRSRS